MPFILLAIGIVLIIAAINDKIGALASQISTDLQAKNGGVSFAAWFAAIVIIGLVGYIPGLTGFSRALLLLVVVVILLKGGTGFFAKLVQQIENPPAPSANPGSPANPAPASPSLPFTQPSPLLPFVSPSLGTGLLY